MFQYRPLEYGVVVFAVLLMPGAGSLSADSIPDKPDTRIFEKFTYGPEDEPIVKDLLQKIETHPKAEQPGLTIQHVPDQLAKIRSPSLKARLLVALADAYLAEGDRQKAKDAYREALDRYGDTDTGLFAGHSLLDLIAKEDFNKAAEMAADILLHKKLTPLQEVHFAGRLGFFLAAAGNPDMALHIVKKAAERHPKLPGATGHAVEDVATTILSTGDPSLRHNKYYEAMRWIEETNPDYAKSPRFLGNYAHACRVSHHPTEALTIMLRIIQNFPEDERVPQYYLEVGDIYRELDDVAAAKLFYNQLLDLPRTSDYVDQLKRIAEAKLRQIEEAEARPRPVFPKTGDTSAMARLGWSAAALITINVCLFAYRYRSRRKTG